MECKVKMKKEKYIAWLQIIKLYASKDMKNVRLSPNTYQNNQEQERVTRKLSILETQV